MEENGTRAGVPDNGAREADSVCSVGQPTSAANATVSTAQRLSLQRYEGFGFVSVLLLGGPSHGRVLDARGPVKQGDALWVYGQAGANYIVMSVTDGAVLAQYNETISRA